MELAILDNDDMSGEVQLPFHLQSLSREHVDSGTTTMTNKTLTDLSLMNGGFIDGNGNELLQFEQTGS